MDFKITYRLYDRGSLVKEGTHRVKNRDRDIFAKIDLEKYLRKKYTFDKFVVVSCEEDSLGRFKDIFGWK
jgi:DNA-binding transcriptional regulator LsrR (DeoR family)